MFTLGSPHERDPQRLTASMSLGGYVLADCILSQIGSWYPPTLSHLHNARPTLDLSKTNKTGQRE